MLSIKFLPPHMRMEQSDPTVSRKSPSLLKAAAETAPECPLSCLVTCMPAASKQNTCTSEGCQHADKSLVSPCIPAEHGADIHTHLDLGNAEA